MLLAIGVRILNETEPLEPAINFVNLKIDSRHDVVGDYAKLLLYLLRQK